MTSVSKKYSWFSVVACLALAAGAVFLGNRMYLNYHGYCRETRTYLSEADIVTALATTAIASNNAKHFPPLQDHIPIPYASVEEFKRINPDCCTPELGQERFYPATFFERMSGQFVVKRMFQYKRRLQNNDGTVTDKLDRKLYGIHACGHTVDPI